jgi:hypothetical protein
MVMVEREALVITSEEEAWVALQAVLDGRYDDRPEPEIVFQGWPTYHIHLENGESSITPSMMEGFIALQEGIYRTHTLLQRGTRNLNVITDEEKRALEIEVKVGGGSSSFDIDPKEVLNTLITQMGAHMDGGQYLILALTIAVLWFGRSSLRDYLQHLKEKREAEVVSRDKALMLQGQQFSSEEETRRMRILVSALGENAKLPAIEEEANLAKLGLLKSLPEDGESTVAGVVISGDVAHEIIKNPRRRSEDVVVDSLFSILRVDTTAPDGFRVRLFDLDNEITITAGVQDLLLSEQQRNIIRAAEWSKTPIRATIEAKRRGTELIDAVIRSVEAARAHAPPV